MAHKPSLLLLFLTGRLDPETIREHMPFVGKIFSWMGDQDLDYGPLLAVIALILILVGFLVFGVSAGNVFTVFIALIPLWLPIILFLLFFKKWMDTVGAIFSLGQGRTTLRIRLPQEVTKSPEAMEFVIAQIHNTANPDNFMQTYLQGKRPLPFSFEIASIGGEVRFYVNVPTKKTRDAFEANMYAQYPNVEIVEEAVDYASEVPVDYDKLGYEVFAVHMGKKQGGHMPIKTYYDYGLDKFPKEEEKVDPMTPMLEVMGGIKPHERIFVQILAISYRKSSFQNGQLQIGEGKNWNEASKKEINTILRRDKDTKLYKPPEGKEGQFGMATQTPGELNAVANIERNMNKPAYNTVIRWLYINTKGGFNGDLINPTIRMFSQFDGNTNGVGVRWRTDFDYKDFFPGKKKKQLMALKKQELKEYRRRVYSPKSGGDDYKIFTSEELATMFHLPGTVALTPTIDRVPSKRGEAPSNLPVGEFKQ